MCGHHLRECTIICTMNMPTFQDAAFDLLDAITKCLGLKGMDPLMMQHIRTCYQTKLAWRITTSLCYNSTIIHHDIIIMLCLKKCLNMGFNLNHIRMSCPAQSKQYTRN